MEGRALVPALPRSVCDSPSRRPKLSQGLTYSMHSSVEDSLEQACCMHVIIATAALWTFVYEYLAGPANPSPGPSVCGFDHATRFRSPQ